MEAPISAYYSGIAWPNDQTCEVVLGNISGFVILFVRASSSVYTCYQLNLNGSTDLGVLQRHSLAQRPNMRGGAREHFRFCDSICQGQFVRIHMLPTECEWKHRSRRITAA